MEAAPRTRAPRRHPPALIALFVIWFEGLTPLMVLVAFGAARELILAVLAVELVLGAFVVRGLARHGRRAQEPDAPSSPAAVSRGGTGRLSAGPAPAQIRGFSGAQWRRCTRSVPLAS